MTLLRNAVAALLLVVLAGCTADPGASTGTGTSPMQVDVDVDTPELRAIKRQAGIADCPATDPAAEPVASGLPEVTLPCLGGGRRVDLSGLRGPLVLNLWAQWCGPCREELPFYQRLHEQAGGRVTVLGVDYQDTQPGAALALAEASGVTYPSVADPAASLRVPFRVRGLPAVVLVDGQGRVVHTEYLVVRSYAQLAGLVEEHLGVRVGGAG